MQNLSVIFRVSLAIQKLNDKQLLIHCEALSLLRFETRQYFERLTGVKPMSFAGIYLIEACFHILLERPLPT